MLKIFEFKKDKYQKKRGGYSSLLEISCKKCSSFLFYYQKDGDGDLFRCYLNRILAPEIYAYLQHSKKNKDVDSLPKLICKKCNASIGSPIQHKDGRLAFHLNQDSFFQKINPNTETNFTNETSLLKFFPLLQSNIYFFSKF